MTGEIPLLLRAARGEIVERPPVWMMRQAGRYMKIYRDLREKYPSFRERSENPDLSLEISLQPWRAFQPEERRPRSMETADDRGDLREGGVALAAVLESVVENEDSVGRAAPFPHELGPRFERRIWLTGRSLRAVQRACQRRQSAQRRFAQAAKCVLLDLVSNRADEHVAAQSLGRRHPIVPSPCDAKLLWLEIRQGKKLSGYILCLTFESGRRDCGWLDHRSEAPASTTR